MGDITLNSIRPNLAVSRKPAGRWGRIVEVNMAIQKVKVSDDGRLLWITFKTLMRDWRTIN